MIIALFHSTKDVWPLRFDKACNRILYDYILCKIVPKEYDYKPSQIPGAKLLSYYNNLQNFMIMPFRLTWFHNSTCMIS